MLLEQKISTQFKLNLSFFLSFSLSFSLFPEKEDACQPDWMDRWMDDINMMTAAGLTTAAVAEVKYN